eukprot:350815-Chlamydomonas_euryale.AAC.2
MAHKYHATHDLYNASNSHATHPIHVHSHTFTHTRLCPCRKQDAAPYKPIDVSSEAVDTAAALLDADRRLAEAFARTRWTALESLIELGGCQGAGEDGAEEGEGKRDRWSRAHGVVRGWINVAVMRSGQCTAVPGGEWVAEVKVHRKSTKPGVSATVRSAHTITLSHAS